MQNEIFYAAPELSAPPPDGMSHGAKVTGFFEVEIWRDGEVIHTEFFNGITVAGFNSLLGVNFHGDTQLPNWYMLLISNGSYSALSSADTMASHAGWTECVAYIETLRQVWPCNAAASQSITNTTEAVFTITVDGTVIKGIGIVSNSTKSGTTGVLWSTGLFSADQTLLAADLLKVKYTINVA